MSDRDERSLLVAPEKDGRKPPSPALPKLNVCGDIGLAIVRDGTWLYQGTSINRKPLVKLFASVLKLDDNGRYYLVTPVEKVEIAVEGLPFVATSLYREGEGKSQKLAFVTNVDDEVTAGREHPLGFEGGVPYVEVRGGLKARLARPVYYELTELAVEGPNGQGQGVWSGGVFFPFPATGDG
jgi:hypothetical protein